MLVATSVWRTGARTYDLGHREGALPLMVLAVVGVVWAGRTVYLRRRNGRR